jgi:hypothetical protein
VKGYSHLPNGALAAQSDLIRLESLHSVADVLVEDQDSHGNGSIHLEYLPRYDGYVRRAAVIAPQQSGSKRLYLTVVEEAEVGTDVPQALAGKSWDLKLFLTVVAIGAVLVVASDDSAVSRT